MENAAFYRNLTFIDINNATNVKRPTVREIFANLLHLGANKKAIK